MRLARCHALAGADVKRHASPAPVGDLGAQGDKGFGAAGGVDAFFFQVAWHGLAVHIARAVLATDHVLAQGLRRPAFEGAQHFEFFIADRIGMGIDGRFHGDGAQQLQRMVLHHVAQRAGGFVKAAAFFHAQFFGNGDLDVGDVLAPPQGLEQGIAKAHGKQVLHRRLAQVMVDAKDLLLFKDLAHRFVDGAVGSQVVAQWFFQHDAGLGRVQSVVGELLTHRGEQAGRGGQVHHHMVSFALGQARFQGGIGLGLGQIHADIAQ